MPHASLVGNRLYQRPRNPSNILFQVSPTHSFNDPEEIVRERDRDRDRNKEREREKGLSFVRDEPSFQEILMQTLLSF